MARKDKTRYDNEIRRYKENLEFRKKGGTSLPKRPMSAYLAFSNQRRAALKTKYPNASNADLSKMLAKTWKEAPLEVKNVYIEEEARLRAQYIVDIAPWKNKKKAKKMGQRDIEHSNVELNHCEDLDCAKLSGATSERGLDPILRAQKMVAPPVPLCTRLEDRHTPNESEQRAHQEQIKRAYLPPELSLQHIRGLCESRSRIAAMRVQAENSFALSEEGTTVLPTSAFMSTRDDRPLTHKDMLRTAPLIQLQPHYQPTQLPRREFPTAIHLPWHSRLLLNQQLREPAGTYYISELPAASPRTGSLLGPSDLYQYERSVQFPSLVTVPVVAPVCISSANPNADVWERYQDARMQYISRMR